MRIQIWHVVVLIVAFVLLFGWKNLPNMARSMGESMRVFKSEVDQMKDEGDARKSEKDAAKPALDERGTTDSARAEYERLREHGSTDSTGTPTGDGTEPRPGEPRA
ncbi:MULTISPECIES: Sec-independent protein translocase subunit TatA [unclassified Serinicoccus]|uniref:Sec-independent protein translocase subunit TatA n=1 Tax=unclassified Serinicoccus TaxID=2643101 RepID=UPI00385260E3